MDPSQLGIVFEHLGCNPASHLVLSLLVSQLGSHRAAVPLWFDLGLLLGLSDAFDETLLGHSGLPSFITDMTLLVLLLISLVPLISHFLLPIWLLLNFIDSVLNHRKRLPHLKILHVLFIIKFVSKLEQLVNLIFFVKFGLLLCHCPRWLLWLRLFSLLL